MINKKSNPQLPGVTVRPIKTHYAKQMVIRNHYMQTFPNGVYVSFGVFYEKRCLGVLSFGYAASTGQKIKKHTGLTLKKNQYLEMMRMWISDDLGHNVESYVLGLVMKQLKTMGVLLVFTHAGGCKNDCGFVYQSSAWQYFGREPCNDFFHCEDGSYKNISGAMRFGRIDAKGKTPQQIGEELFGPGEILKSWRYNYAYPISKGIRKKLNKITKPYPKESEVYRNNQEWVNINESGVAS